jgi:hypothetical protein
MIIGVDPRSEHPIQETNHVDNDVMIPGIAARVNGTARLLIKIDQQLEETP